MPHCITLYSTEYTTDYFSLSRIDDREEKLCCVPSYPPSVLPSTHSHPRLDGADRGKRRRARQSRGGDMMQEGRNELATNSGSDCIQAKRFSCPILSYLTLSYLVTTLSCLVHGSHSTHHSMFGQGMTNRQSQLLSSSLSLSLDGHNVRAAADVIGLHRVGWDGVPGYPPPSLPRPGLVPVLPLSACTSSCILMYTYAVRMRGDARKKQESEEE